MTTSRSFRLESFLIPFFTFVCLTVSGQNRLAIGSSLNYSNLYSEPMSEMFGFNMELYKEKKDGKIIGYGINLGYNETDRIFQNSAAIRGYSFKRYLVQLDGKLKSNLFQDSNTFSLHYLSSMYYVNDYVKPVITSENPVRTHNIGQGLGLSPQYLIPISKNSYVNISMPIMISAYDFEREYTDAIDQFEQARIKDNWTFFSNYFISFRLGFAFNTGPRKKSRRRR